MQCEKISTLSSPTQHPDRPCPTWMMVRSSIAAFSTGTSVWQRVARRSPKPPGVLCRFAGENDQFLGQFQYPVQLAE